MKSFFTRANDPTEHCEPEQSPFKAHEPYLITLLQMLFNPDNGLFRENERTHRIELNPRCVIIPNHLKLYELAGRFLGYAIHDKLKINVDFATGVVKKLMMREVSINDLEDSNPELAQELRTVLHHKTIDESYQGYFNYRLSCLEKKLMKSLQDGGNYVPVTEMNKEDFIRRIIRAKFNEELVEEYNAFRRGFHSIIPIKYLSLLSPSEFELLFYQNCQQTKSVILEKMKLVDISENSNCFKWFKEKVESLNDEELKMFCYLLHGSQNVKEFNFKSSILSHSYHTMFHTSFHEIENPVYTSKEEFDLRFTQALLNPKEEFYHKNYVMYLNLLKPTINYY